jgi:hypothetical protein
MRLKNTGRGNPPINRRQNMTKEEAYLEEKHLQEGEE